jgi:methionyl-tRNA formyltransferase
VSRPKIAFMGTPEFSVPSLAACLDVGEVVVVVTQPDKPKGRGQAVSISPVKAIGLERGLSILQPAKIRGTNFAEELRAFAPDVSVVTAYGKILPKDVLEVPRFGSLNVHASLLPRWRGAAPIQRAIAAGDLVSGITLMKMDEGMDTGAMLAQRPVALSPDETGKSLHDALSTVGAAIVRELLGKYLAGDLASIPQPTSGVTLAPMLRKEEGQLDFSRPAVDLERQVRAFTPWPGTFTLLEGALFKVHRASLGRPDLHEAPGRVLSTAEAIEVSCGEGTLQLLEVQPEGRRRMTAGEFIAGHPLVRGSAPFGGAKA